MISMSTSPQAAFASQMMKPTMPRNEPASAVDPEGAWKQIVERDAAASFVYGVTTTGVFCRPGCASRRPGRENVRFFRTAGEAEAAGFRPCMRCRPADAVLDGNLDWSRAAVERVVAHIERNFGRPVGLEELGRLAGMSPFTVQKRFKRAMGVSPLEYQRALRAGRLRKALRKGDSVTDAIYDAGFSSSSRAYEGSALGMTPSRFKRRGARRAHCVHLPRARLTAG